MSSSKSKKSWEERRRCKYVDTRIQGGLVAALLGLQVLLFTAAMLILHHELSRVIEDQLYRIHLGPQEGMPVLIKELLVIVPFIIAANVAVVIGIDWAWSRYINRIIRLLMRKLKAASSLDLRCFSTGHVHHEVIEKADEWIKGENERYRRLQQFSAQLHAEMPPELAAEKIEQMRQLLPYK